MAKSRAKGVLVDGSKYTLFKRFLDRISSFFSRPRLPKEDSQSVVKSTIQDSSAKVTTQDSATNDTETSIAKAERTTSIFNGISTVVTSVFGFLSTNKNRQIEEEKTRQLQLQLEGEQDADIQELLRAKLDVQIAQLNASVEADKQKSIVSLVVFLIVGVFFSVIVVLIFRRKREEIPSSKPIIIDPYSNVQLTKPV